MRARIFLLMTVLSAAIALPDAANAQLSPQGLLNGMTRPLRSMLGHLGHFPRHRGHREAAIERPDAGRTNTPSEGRLDRAGPAAWPTAYEDVLGYAFWPDEYAQRLRGHGFDIIADTITGRFEASRTPLQASTSGSAVQDDAGGAGCREPTATNDTWPSTRIGQTVQLTNVQHDAVETIQKAVSQSAKTIKGDCTDTNAAAAPDRLRALVQTLWAAHDAGAALRTPIKQFDATLTDAQKTSFGSRMPQETPRPDARNMNPVMNRQYQGCAAPNVEEAERLIKLIELRVRPNKDQAASLENLHKTSSDMAKMLMASCAQPIPADPLARLDAADDQLTAMNYAATTMQIAFDEFYSKLDNVQKARFEAMGR